MGLKPRVAIIDGGITYSNIKTDKILTSVSYRMCSINNLGEISIKEKEDKKPETIHGIIIANIINEICPNVLFYDINILNEKLECDARLLLKALERTLEIKPDIIHMSLGTTKLKWYWPLKKLIKKILAEKIIIVSAKNNNNKLSFPADFKDVIKVRANHNKSPKKLIYFSRGVWYAPPQDIFSDKYTNMQGNSISAAYITGLIASGQINISKRGKGLNGKRSFNGQDDSSLERKWC